MLARQAVLDLEAGVAELGIQSASHSVLQPIEHYARTVRARTQRPELQSPVLCASLPDNALLLLTEALQHLRKQHFP